MVSLTRLLAVGVSLLVTVAVASCDGEPAITPASSPSPTTMVAATASANATVDAASGRVSAESQPQPTAQSSSAAQSTTPPASAPAASVSSSSGQPTASSTGSSPSSADPNSSVMVANTAAPGQTIEPATPATSTENSDRRTARGDSATTTPTQAGSSVAAAAIGQASSCGDFSLAADQVASSVTVSNGGTCARAVQLITGVAATRDLGKPGDFNSDTFTCTSVIGAEGLPVETYTCVDGSVTVQWRRR